MGEYDDIDGFINSNSILDTMKGRHVFVIVVKGECLEKVKELITHFYNIIDYDYR